MTSTPTSRYASLDTETLVAMRDMPGFLGLPAVVAELQARGIDRRQSERRIAERVAGTDRRSANGMRTA